MSNLAQIIKSIAIKEIEGYVTVTSKRGGVATKVNIHGRENYSFLLPGDQSIKGYVKVDVKRKFRNPLKHHSHEDYGYALNIENINYKNK